jgi:hypothetical protein
MPVSVKDPSMKDDGKTEAVWSVRLLCTCPKCRKRLDLLKVDDFWEGRSLALAEHGTVRSRDIPVACPACGWEFKVDCVY